MESTEPRSQVEDVDDFLNQAAIQDQNGAAESRVQNIDAFIEAAKTDIFLEAVKADDNQDLQELQRMAQKREELKAQEVL